MGAPELISNLNTSMIKDNDRSKGRIGAEFKPKHVPGYGKLLNIMDAGEMN